MAMNNEEDYLKGYGMALVTLANRINEQDCIITELKQEISWIKMFIKGLPKIVEGDN